MRVEIVTIGDELLLGFTVDTNSAYLSRGLSALGIEVARHTSIRDVREQIIEQVSAALDRTGAVITSGGLGPTNDDITAESIAHLFGRDMVEDPGIVARLEEFFRSRGYKGELSATNRRQALVPAGAQLLHNRYGLAPGIWLEDERGRWVAMLPGVPRELRGLFEDEVAPRVSERLGGEGHRVVSGTLRTTGIPEAVLAQRIRDAGLEIEGLAYLPGWAGVDLRVTVRGETRLEAGARIRRDLDLLRAVAGDRVYGENSEDLAGVVLSLARTQNLVLAVAESCTGGLLGGRLTAIPGASDIFAGGVIAYANEVKVAQLDVPRELLAASGAVSEPVVRAMAGGVRRRFGAGIGIAISGIAGPEGGTPEKPVGTVSVCVDTDRATAAGTRILNGDREEIRQRATQMALDMTRGVLGG